MIKKERKDYGDPSFILALLYIVSMPFLMNNYMKPIFPPPVGGKIQVSEVFYVFLLSFFVLSLMRKKAKITYSPFVYSLIVYLLAMLAATAFSKNIRTSIVEYVGLLYLSSLSVILPSIIDTRRKLLLCASALLYSAALVSAIGIGGYALSRFLHVSNPFVLYYSMFMKGEWRLVSTLILPNMAYSYLHIAFFTGLGILAFTEGGRRIFKISAIGLIFLAIALTFSRGYVAFAGSAAAYLLVLHHRKVFDMRYLKIAGSFFILAAIALFIFVQLFISLATDVSFSYKSGYSKDRFVNLSGEANGIAFKEDDIFEKGRPYNEFAVKVDYLPGFYWFKKKSALMLISKRPLVGVGPGNFNTEDWLLRAGSGKKAFGYMTLEKKNDPHSTYFGSLAESGVLGFISLVVLLVIFLKSVYDHTGNTSDIRLNNFAIAGLSAVFGMLLIGFDMDILNFRWLWVMMGLSLAVIRLKQKTIKE